MKTLVVALVAVGCAKDPLLEDMRMFCRAADVENAQDVMHIIPYVAQRVKTDELRAVIGMVRDPMTNASDFLAAGDALAKKAGVDDCQTVKVLRRRMQARGE